MSDLADQEAISAAVQRLRDQRVPVDLGHGITIHLRRPTASALAQIVQTIQRLADGQPAEKYTELDLAADCLQACQSDVSRSSAYDLLAATRGHNGTLAQQALHLCGFRAANNKTPSGEALDPTRTSPPSPASD